MVSVDCPEGCDEAVPDALLLDHLVDSHDYDYEDAHEVVLEETSFLDGPPLDDFGDALLVQLYHRMRSIRRLEETLMDLAAEGAIPGTPHPCIGQEGSAVGTCFALGDDDIIASTHRGHGHVLAQGADPATMIAEIGGRETGMNDGRGGTMHMADLDLGILGQNAIVGANASQVVGAVLQEQLAGEDTVGVAFFGEGAMNQGAAAEAFNMAAMWDLPVIFACENNRYQVTFSWKESVSTEHLPDRAAGFDMEATTINAQDVLTVYDHVRSLADRARDGEGPFFVENQTYRYCGHFASEDRLGGLEYRPEGEMAYWETFRDPIANLAEDLEEEGILSADEREEIHDEIEATLEDAVAFMEDSDHPPAEDAVEDVYANQDYQNFPAAGYR